MRTSANYSVHDGMMSLLSPAIEDHEMLSRFKGVLVGAVVGDCIGAFYENSSIVHLDSVLEFISKKLETQEVVAEYTDDTAMTRSVASSLINNKQLDVSDLARRFTTEYFSQPNRGYGRNVSAVFSALRDERYKDVYGPASRQFGGSGSFGNGGAMRIAPAALYGYNMTDSELDTMTSDITKITHTSRNAVNGAILQCVAVQYILKQDRETFNSTKFLDDLILRLSDIESSDDPNKSEMPYCDKLELIKQYVTSETDPSLSVITETIGNGISALEACSAAIYSFTRCYKDVADIPQRNPFERTIIHSISLGGDTDTIATMSGAIAGALYGIEMIPASWQQACEGVKDAIEQAEELYKLAGEPT